MAWVQVGTKRNAEKGRERNLSSTNRSVRLLALNLDFFFLTENVTHLNNWIFKSVLYILLDQMFSSDAIVLESICYRTRANRLINVSKTTRGLRKIWTGSTLFLCLRQCTGLKIRNLYTLLDLLVHFFQPSSRIALLGQLLCCCTMPDQIHFDYPSNFFSAIPSY